VLLDSELIIKEHNTSTKSPAHASTTSPAQTAETSHVSRGYEIACPAASTGLLQLNAATCLTSDSCRYDHVTPLLNDLHWLRVPERSITYKLCVLVYNCLHGTAPRYLQNVIQPVAEVTSRCRLRSASSSGLVVPATRRSSLGDRAFAVAGPRAWFSLPEFVSNCSSLLTFKKYLKTFF